MRGWRIHCLDAGITVFSHLRIFRARGTADHQCSTGLQDAQGTTGAVVRIFL